MRTAAVLDRDHPAVGDGELVGAHAESGLQRARQRDEEPAAAARRGCLLGHRGVRAEVGILPAFGGVQPALPGQHPFPAQAQLEGHLLDLRIARVGVARHQSRIVLRRWQQIAGAQVTRLQPLAPRHPGRSQQRTFAGQQHHLGHPRRRVRCPHHGDRPVPADIAGQPRRERVGGRIRSLRPYPEVTADLGLRPARFDDADIGAGQLDRRRPGGLHRRGDGLVDGERLGRCLHSGHCLIVSSGQCRHRCRPPRAYRCGKLVG